MSTDLPSSSRRGTQRASHLRHVSTGSPDGTDNPKSQPMASPLGTVQQEPISLKVSSERRCNLWHHDDAFSKDDVVLNLDLFPDVREGDLMAVMALKTDSGVRDFQDTVQATKIDGEALSAAGQRDRSSSNPRSPSAASGSNVKHDIEQGKQYLFEARDMTKEMRAKQPTLEISMAKAIADAFHLKSRSQVLVTTTDSAANTASHVELCFKDEYLSRSDMWRLAVGELANKTVFRGQKILFMGTIKANVSAIYIAGRKVQSAFYSTNTKPVFRSESARYVLFIQMSREMWDFDSEGSGEIMFNKVVNGFLPALFKKWVSLKAKHLVSIILFTRVEYETGITSELATAIHDSAYHTGCQAEGSKKPYKDFYRVVVSEMASGSWTTILYQLKREFKFFRRDISMHRINLTSSLQSIPGSTAKEVLGTQIEAEPSLAMHGNVLEAINLASSQFAHDYIDRDLMRTGISIVIITPSPGLFEVDYETLKMTTETLVGNGIGIDLVCLPKMPLHSVPLFRYRNPQYGAFQEALHLKSFISEDSTPRQTPAMFGSSFSSINESLSPEKASYHDRSHRGGSFSTAVPPSEWSYAIPHWIDVSFWTGASQDIHLGDPLSKPASKYRRVDSTERSQDFAIRCKMYEMEMASVMENVLTEIAVTPLQQDAHFPQMTVGPRVIPGSRHSLEETWGSVRRTKVLASLSELVSGPSKARYDRSSSQDEKSLYKATDKFDAAVSEISESVFEPRQNGEGRRSFKPGSEEAAMKILAEDPKIFGTSLDENGTLNGSSNLRTPSKLGKGKLHMHREEEPVKAQKDSVSSSISVKTSPARTQKFGRQISLSKFGFGIAAPKAATAEIQMENASAARPTPTSNKSSDMKKSSSNTIPGHLLHSTTQNRPTSSHSERSKTNPETPPSELEEKPIDSPRALGGRPMTIKSALQSLDSTNQFKSRSMLGSIYESQSNFDDRSSVNTIQMRINDNQKLFNSKLLAESVPELPATLSPTTALSPWLSVLNPSNPTANDEAGPSQYRRWQHVFPKPIHTNTMKWKSLCCPASVPLTTEYFPSKHQLDTEYQQKPYNISPNTDDDMSEDPKSRDKFLRELVGLRLSQGFQIVLGSTVAKAFGQKSLKIANVFDPDDIAEDGASIFMSMGNIIHQLSCVNESEVEVNVFVRKPIASTVSKPDGVLPSVYKPAIQTTLDSQYASRQIMLGKTKDEYNWNYVDSFIAGFDEEMSESLRFWRARFVLIPMERSTQSHRHQGEDNEEEVRLEGIKKLTQTWQRHRILSASEKRFQSLAARKTKENPLDIVYKTEDPSIVVTAELETLPLVETSNPGMQKSILIETESFRQNKFDVAALAEAIQASVERGGVRMQNRRWHFRLHYNCFIGSDMATWLIENFEDINTREEAVELGNKLMAKDELQRIRESQISKDNGKDKDKEMGIFVHVEKRHPFRDGQYFYQVTGEFAKQRPESRSGWFGSRRRDQSIPSTPMSEAMARDTPRPERSRSSSNYDERSSDSGTTTPTTAGGFGGKKPRVALSKVMKYDVDHRRRSYRPERINLHYDRLHNPDNCYHIRIDWIGATAKLIEDAIETWARTAESYGLRLVEAPIGEACNITSIHPFRNPYIITLASPPPDQQPRSYFDVNSFGPQLQASPASRHYYQKAIMKRFNFVLDIEAARNFPANVDVTYSWGRPDYKYTQYIHRSGVLLAQITDEGAFLLLANRLFNNRTAAARELDRYVKVESSHNSSNTERRMNMVHGLNLDKATPPCSPLARPFNTTGGAGGIHTNYFTTSSSSFPSPTLRATSDVLGPSAKFSASVTTPENIKAELEEFCHSIPHLENFYKELLEKATPPRDTPPSLRSPYLGHLLDSNIPTLGLPPSLTLGRDAVLRDTSPSPMRLRDISGVGSPMPQLGRRPSVQPGWSGGESAARTISNSTADRNSPRGSIAEGDAK